MQSYEPMTPFFDEAIREIGLHPHFFTNSIDHITNNDELGKNSGPVA